VQCVDIVIHCKASIRNPLLSLRSEQPKRVLLTEKDTMFYVFYRNAKRYACFDSSRQYVDNTCLSVFNTFKDVEI
jgi:hypothetical protein